MSEKTLLKAILTLLALIFLAMTLPEDIFYIIRYRLASFVSRETLLVLIIVVIPAGVAAYFSIREEHRE